MPDEIEGGIEWLEEDGDRYPYCARCGDHASIAACWCNNEDLLGARCDDCGDSGGTYHCINTPEFCEQNPMPGREHIQSTALSAEEWHEYDF